MEEDNKQKMFEEEERRKQKMAELEYKRTQFERQKRQIEIRRKQVEDEMRSYLNDERTKIKPRGPSKERVIIRTGYKNEQKSMSVGLNETGKSSITQQLIESHTENYVQNKLNSSELNQSEIIQNASAIQPSGDYTALDTSALNNASAILGTAPGQTTYSLAYSQQISSPKFKQPNDSGPLKRASVNNERNILGV